VHWGRIVFLGYQVFFQLSFQFAWGKAPLLASQFPQEIKLTKFLTAPSGLQEFGACHIYSAVAAAQATCARKTGQNFTISESLLFGLHLKAQADPKRGYSYLRRGSDGEFSMNDAGEYINTIQRIKWGYVYDGQTYRRENLERALKRAESVRREYEMANASGTLSQESRVAYEWQMRKALIEELDLSFKEAKKISGESACGFDQLQSLDFVPQGTQGAELIRRGFPYICQHFFDSENIQRGSHVVLVAGYKLPVKPGGKILYYVRDSRVREMLMLRSLDCYRATVLYYPHEESRLRFLNIKMDY
jgi:hypothetical protein